MKTIKFLLEVIISIILLTSSNISFSQLHQRSGWPINFCTQGGLVQKNSTTWIQDSSGRIIIGLGSKYGIGLFDLDGNAIEGWPDILEGTDWFGNVGPRFGDVDGDGEYEVVYLLRDAYGGIRKLVVKELDGTDIPILCREYGEFSYRGKLSPVVLTDVNHDGAEEIIFTCDSLYVLQGDGCNYPGFPRTIGELYNKRSGPLYIPDSISNGDVILYSSDTLLYAEPFHSTTNFQSWTVPIPDSTSHTNPLLIPTENDWVVAIANALNLFVYNSSGVLVEGFPIPITPLEENVKLFDISACDVNGDDIPEIITRKMDGMIKAFNLQGEILPGFPVGEIWNDGDQVVSLRVEGEDEAYMFHAAYFDAEQSAIWGYKGSTMLEGFPGLVTPRELMFEAAAIIWTENDDTLHIIHNINNGIATVWDYPMPGKAVRLEWPMPGNDPGGKRIYQTRQYLSVPQQQKDADLPDESNIQGVYPNPSNNGAMIKVALTDKSSVNLKIFNILGREVWRQEIKSIQDKTHLIHWEGVDSYGNPVPSGHYFVQLGSNQTSRSLIILK